jgi:DNA polymerase (family X)
MSRLPYATAQALASKFIESVRYSQAWVPRPRLMVVGSLRRRASTVKDIDILMIAPDQLRSKTAVLLPSVSSKYIVRGTQKAKRRRTVWIKVGQEERQLDLFLAFEKELPYALLHHTGPREFNIRVRSHAKARGYLLNQYGVHHRHSGWRVSWRGPRTEQGVLQFLKVTYQSPSERN